MSGAQYPGKRFAVDIMLGKLAKWLRVLGFDASSMLLDDRVRVDRLMSEGIIPVTVERNSETLRALSSFATIIRSSS